MSSSKIMTFKIFTELVKEQHVIPVFFSICSFKSMSDYDIILGIPWQCAKFIILEESLK